MLSQPPAISVVVPTYQRLRYLPETVRSVLRQTFGDLELIVADDGSTDGTTAYLETVRDPRLRRVGMAHSGNIAQVRNRGAAEASGRYLCFVDSDDLWYPEKLSIQVEAMARSGARWSYGAFELVDAEGRPARMRAGAWQALSGDIAEPLILTEAAVALCTVLMERSLFHEVGGFDEDPELVLREDFEFLVRLALATATCAVPDVLAQVRDHSGRATRAQGGAAPFLTSAHAYTRLLEVVGSPRLRRAARRRRAVHRARAGLRLGMGGSPGPAAICLLRALGDAAASAVPIRPAGDGTGR